MSYEVKRKKRNEVVANQPIDGPKQRTSQVQVADLDLATQSNEHRKSNLPILIG